MLEKIKRFYRIYIKDTPKFKVNYKTKVERHGTVYGGWNIIPNSLTKDSIVYSIGIGEDISFDLSIIKKYQCNVQAFDPTPRVIEWLKSQKLPKEFIFHPLALSANDGTLTFHTPKVETNISHTAYGNEETNTILVPAKSLKTIANDLGNSKIDLVKMDIEGFEYDVLIDILKNGIKPKQLLIEFHHFFPEVGNKKT